MRIRLFTGLVALIAVSAAAGAAPSLEFSVGLCAAQTNAEARLACYDAIAAKLRSGDGPVAAPAPAAAPFAPTVTAPTVAATPPAPVGAASAAVTAAPKPEAQFGAEALAKETREAAGQPAQLDQIHAVIQALAFAPNGRAIVTLENGQVWRQIDGDTSPFKGKKGELATIERGILGSFNLTVEGRKQLVKVQRVR